MLGRFLPLLTCLLVATAGCLPVGNSDLPNDPQLLDVDADGLSAADGDCDDGDADIYPAAPERCNGLDDDCDGTADEGFDLDGDGVATCDQVSTFTDCDDTDASAYPGAQEVCDGVDNDCDSLKDEGFDLDRDGFSSCAALDDPPDCDDTNSGIYPGNRNPICDGLDNDCDGDVDEGFDNDKDGVPRCRLGDEPADCDDSQALVYPGAEEICDALNNDCDTLIDEGFDGDDDGFFTCRSATQTGVTIPKDCDDGAAAINPEAQELCSEENLGVDEDCDGLIDDTDPDVVGQRLYYRDADSDAAGDPNISILTCSPPQGYVDNDDDCDDTNPAIGADATWFPDADGDGFGVTVGAQEQCHSPGEGYVTRSGDCDDQDAGVYPEAEEGCNGGDDDCDQSIDEGLDVDGDSDGAAFCHEGDRYDCDDTDSDVFPDAEERCDPVDHDCDGTTDEGLDGDGDGITACGGEGAAIDCDDSDNSIYPGADEQCDAVDHDCDGPVDEGFDGDGDGVTSCGAGGAVVDCDDEDPERYQGADERCNRLDDDCDEQVDEDFDVDGDGYFTCDPVEPPSDLDCDDGDAAVYPGAEEICDGGDQNCSGGGGDLYVGASAEGAESSTIQGAIDMAAGDGCVIVVAPGFYNERVSFAGKSLQLVSEAGPAQTVINGALEGAGNGATVVFAEAEGEGAVLEGFTITGGTGSELGGYPLGGGVRIDAGAGPTLRGNVITGNQAESGGGVGCVGCVGARLEDNDIGLNVAQHRVGPLGGINNGRGGGIYISGGQVTLIGNRVTDNVGTIVGGGVAVLGASVVVSSGDEILGNRGDVATFSRGGGIALEDAAFLTLEQVVISDNRAVHGGGIAVHGDAVLLGQELTLEGNEAVGLASEDVEAWGGGLLVRGGSSDAPRVEIDGCYLGANVAGADTTGRGGNAFVGLATGRLKHCVIDGGSASVWGGGLYLWASTLPVINNIFTENSALLGGGAVLDSVSEAHLVNNVLALNESLNVVQLSGGGGAIYLYDSNGQVFNNVLLANEAQTGGTIYYAEDRIAYDANTLQYNAFYDNIGGDTGGEIETLTGARGNVMVDPQFVDVPSGDFHLSAGSDLIDAGHPSAAFDDVDGSACDIGAFGGPQGGWQPPPVEGAQGQ